MSTDESAVVDEAPFAKTELEVDSLLGAAIDAASRNESGVAITQVAGDHAAVVLGDRAKLERALERLLSVAVRCSRSGGTVTVALGRVSRGWSIRVEHAIRPDLDPNVGADCRLRLALVGAALHAHGGSYRASVAGGFRSLVLTLPDA